MDDEVPNFEELEVVNSIYEGCIEPWSEGVYLVNIPETPVSVKLRIPGDYPEAGAPSVLQVKAPRMDEKKLASKIESVIKSSFIPGEVYLFSFIDEVRQLLPDNFPEDPMPSSITESADSQHINNWARSDDIVDRKSVFVGRAIEVHSEDQARFLIQDLLLDKRIARATHNISAWRIDISSSTFSQNCDDDGENAAGGRILHLLNITKVRNVLVVVTRWYGGIHLGPDRFKHINSCARNALVAGHFLAEK